MAADPYSALISTGLDLVGGTLSAIPSLVPTAYDKANRKRIKELERMSELDALGLTEEEKQALFGAYARTAQAGREAAQAQTEAAAQAFSSAGTGQALKQAQLGQEAQARTEADIQARVLAADQARAQALAQELEDRLAYRAQRQKEQISAATSLFMPLIGGAKEQGALAQTTRQPTAEEQQGEILDEETKSLLNELYNFGE